MHDTKVGPFNTVYYCTYDFGTETNLLLISSEFCYKTVFGKTETKIRQCFEAGKTAHIGKHQQFFVVVVEKHKSDHA